MPSFLLAEDLRSNKQMTELHKDVSAKLHVRLAAAITGSFSHSIWHNKSTDKI